MNRRAALEQGGRRLILIKARPSQTRFKMRTDVLALGAPRALRLPGGGQAMSTDDQSWRVPLSLPRRLTHPLWLLLAGVAAALCAIWLYAPLTGNVGLWALLPLLVSAAMIVATAHHLAQRHHAGRPQYERNRKPLAGPRPGARLPQ